MFPDKIIIVIFLFSSLLFDIHTRDIQTFCSSKQPLQCYNTGECDVHLPYSKESTFWLNSALRFLLRKARAGSFPIIAACKTGRSTGGKSQAVWRFLGHHPQLYLKVWGEPMMGRLAVWYSVCEAGQRCRRLADGHYFQACVFQFACDDDSFEFWEKEAAPVPPEAKTKKLYRISPDSFCFRFSL